METLREFCNESILPLTSDLGISARLTTYPAGALVFGQGEPADTLYIICRGLVKLAYILEDGRSSTLSILKPGDLLGKGLFLPDLRFRRAYAETLEPTDLLPLDLSDFFKLLSNSEDLLRQVLRSLAYEALALQARLLASTYGSVREQLATLLWLLQERYGVRSSQGVTLTLRLTCRTLAEMLGSSRQSVNRALQILRKMNLIQGRYGKIVITDVPGLFQLARPFLFGREGIVPLTDSPYQPR